MEEDKAECRDEKDPLSCLVFTYDAFQADQNDDGGLGDRRIGFHAPTRTVDNRRVAVPKVARVR